MPRAIKIMNAVPTQQNYSSDEKTVSENLGDLDNSQLSEEVGAAAKPKGTARDRYDEVLNLSALYGGQKGGKR